ncbi:MAG: hypothetical protein UHU21_01795 [Lachnospiraceae bacterium]|nr:hypothetical protein [Lachnospiraceae bacterium]
MEKHIYDNTNGLWYELCIRRSPAAAGAVVNGSSAVTAAAV